VIPSEIMAHDLRFAALFSDWRLELMSTNWLGYWIIQLTSENHKPLAMLINLDHLTAICTSMRLCIDTANNPSQYPGATTMLQRVAVDLPTQDNTDGAITILSDWQERPYLNINYYRHRKVGRERARITQAFSIEDAERLYNFFATVYNQFPEKGAWTPRWRPSLTSSVS